MCSNIVFKDSLNSICSCGNDIETSAYFLLHCPNFSNERSTLLNIIGSIDRNILTRSDSQVTETLLYGDSNSNNITNTLILNTTIDFLIATKRFDTFDGVYIYIYIYVYIYIDCIYIYICVYIYIYIYLSIYLSSKCFK